MSSMWQGFRSAIQFLTLFPCGSHQAFDARRSLPWFPLCGLLMGCVLAVVDKAAMQVWSPTTVSVLTVAALAAISGGLHLDGLADTADGLYSRRAPADAMAIMKDSRIGAMGMLMVVFCLAIKWAGLAGIEAHRSLYLMLIPAYSRTAVLFGIQRLPYGRPDGGTGHDFFHAPLKLKDFWGLVLVLLISVLLGWKALVVNVIFLGVVVGTIAFYRRKIGCITGDMLGAMIECTETVLFLVASARWSI